MNWRWFAKVLCVASTLCVGAHVRAELVWLQRDGAQLQAHIGELSAPASALPPLKDAQALMAGRADTSVTIAADHYSFVSGDGDARFTALQIGSNGVLTYFQARYGRQIYAWRWLGA